MHDDGPANGQPINLDAALQQEIANLAREQGTSPSEVIRAGLDALRRRTQHTPAAHEDETVLDRWTRLGVVGIVDDPSLPDDLSTNKRHMEGFGRD